MPRKKCCSLFARRSQESRPRHRPSRTVPTAPAWSSSQVACSPWAPLKTSRSAKIRGPAQQCKSRQLRHRCDRSHPWPIRCVCEGDPPQTPGQWLLFKYGFSSDVTGQATDKNASWRNPGVQQTNIQSPACPGRTQRTTPNGWLAKPATTPAGSAAAPGTTLLRSSGPPAAPGSNLTFPGTTAASAWPGTFPQPSWQTFPRISRICNHQRSNLKHLNARGATQCAEQYSRNPDPR